MTFRLLVVALAGCLMLPSLHAQRSHGIGASVTSVSPQGGSFNNPGIPASVTSITPSARPNRGGTFSTNPNRGRRHGHGFGHGNKFVPIFVPTYSYGYPGFYPDASAYDDSAMQPAPEDPRPPALTIFENRPGYRPPPVERYADRSTPSADPSRESASRETEAIREPEPVADQVPTVLVFRDGRRIEIGNYAIQGDLIYNLGSAGPRKIKLADLDLDKTIQANDERGNEFRLPRKFRG